MVYYLHRMTPNLYLSILYIYLFDVTHFSWLYVINMCIVLLFLGIGGFYRGLSASYFGCIEGGFQWVIYENLKLRIQKYKQNLNAVDNIDGNGKLKEVTV